MISGRNGPWMEVPVSIIFTHRTVFGALADAAGGALDVAGAGGQGCVRSASGARASSGQVKPRASSVVVVGAVDGVLDGADATSVGSARITGARLAPQLTHGRAINKMQARTVVPQCSQIMRSH